MEYNVRTFRLDVGDRVEKDVEDKIKEFLDRNVDDIKKYCICYEISEKTKKPHYQGFMYVSKSVKKFENISRHFADFKPSEKSFAPAKNIESVRKYAKKDGDFRFCNFSDEELDEMGNWEVMEHKSKAEKKLTHRQQFYASFLDYCEKHPSVDMGKYNLRWVAERLYEFLGKEPLPEQTSWCKGMIFSAQTHLLSYNKDCSKSRKSVEEWCDRILY